jgi:hypothetical protein
MRYERCTGEIYTAPVGAEVDADTLGTAFFV